MSPSPALTGSSSQAWLARCGVLSVLVMPSLFLAACSTPASRAREQAVSLASLSPADKGLVQQGGIRKGFTRETVRIAWGAPDEVLSASPAKGPLEVWLYNHTYYGEGGGYYGVPRGLVYVPAEGRYHYDTDDFYEPPVQLRGFNRVYTEVPYRKAYFEAGRVVNFSDLQAGDRSASPARN